MCSFVDLCPVAGAVCWSVAFGVAIGVDLFLCLCPYLSLCIGKFLVFVICSPLSSHHWIIYV